MIKVEFCMHESEAEMLNRIREAMESVDAIYKDAGCSGPKYEYHLCNAVEELAQAYSTYVAGLVYNTGKELK